MPDDASLHELAGAIVDGSSIDWSAAESDGEASVRDVVRELKVIAGIAGVHGSASLPSDDAQVSPHPAGADDTGGRIWGPLRLLEKIGEGAYGEVFRAWDTRLDREVALKLLPAGRASARTTSSIVHEGRLLARVRHPNVVTIYGAETIDNRVGLWMELVRGRTLEQMLKEGTLFSAAEATRIGIDICRAVSAVHGAGLLHRDIKAHNVMLADDGRVVLMDFGTGQEIQAGSSIALAGTPVYLAPEVLFGNPATMQSDIYSIGVLLFHLLSGSYPMQGRSTPDVRRAHEENARVSLKTVRLDAPASLVAVIDRALDPLPARRHPSATALATELVALRPRSLATRWLAGLATFALIAAAAGTLLLRGGRLVPSGSDSQASRATAGISALVTAPGVAATHRLTQTGNSLGAGISPDGKFVVYVDNQAGRSSLWLRLLTSHSSQQIMPPGSVRSSQPAISPDGRSLYVIGLRRDAERSGLYKMPVTGGVPPTLIYEHADLQAGLALSPDGGRVALIRNSRIRDESVVLVVDATGGGEKTLATRKYSDGYWQIAWSPDGRSLAAAAGNADTGGRNMNVVSLNLDDGAERTITHQPMAFVGNLAWLADSSGLLMVATDALPRENQIWYLSYPNGVAHKITDDANRYRGLSLSADSTALVTGQHRSRRTIWVAPANDAASPRTPGSLVVETARAREIASGYIRLRWTPDGQIVYGSLASGTTNLWRANSDGTNPRQLTTVGLE